jgi:hypothetical protein
MTLVGSKLFVFGGVNAKRHSNDIWALDLDSCTFAQLPLASLSHFDQIFHQ